jgi:uncharacterized protein
MMYLLLGIFAGLLAGILGIGGGLLVTPALVFIFHQVSFTPPNTVQIAAGTSLAVIAINSCVSFITYHQNKNVDWETIKILLPSLLIGACIGTLIGHLVSNQFLAHFLGIFIILVAIQMQFKWKNPTADPTLKNIWIFRSAGIFSSILGGLIGVGGSVIIIPFLDYLQFPIQRVTGTAIACSFFVALSSIFTLTLLPYFSTHSQMSYIFWPAVLWIAPTSIIFAWVGASIANRLPTNLMRKILSIFLIFVGIRLVIFSPLS